MNPKRGQFWVRRPWNDEADDIDIKNMHVTLACLGPGRFLSVDGHGEIHVWPTTSNGPDWNAWEPVTEGE